MSYIGMIANIVGGEMQGWAAHLEKQAQAKAFAEEMARQGEFRRQGAGVMQTGIQGSSKEQSDVDRAAGTQMRMGDYSRLGAVPMGFGTPNQATLGKDQAYGQMRGATRANLGSYSDWGLQQMIRQLQTQQALNKITSFAGGDAQVFPYQMYKAGHSWDDLAMAGAGISAIGGGAANWSQYSQPPPTQGQPIYGANLPTAYQGYYGTGPMSPYANTLYGGMIG